MSVGIDFYKMAKSVNSTRLPDENTESIHYSGTFKNGTNILAPTVVLNASGGITYYNYCYIPAFDRYYFVVNWTYVEGAFWEATLSCDVMASLKSIIGASSQYVERAYSEWNGFAEDSLYPGLAMAPVQSLAISAGYNVFGTFIVGISGCANGGSTGGGTCYFAFSQSQMNSFISLLFDMTTYSGLSGENLFYFNPFQYVTSVRWYPLTLAAVTTTNLNLGFYELMTGAPVANEVYNIPQVSFLVPEHPQAAARGRYLNAAPFSTHRLYLPGVGELPISFDSLSTNSRSVTITGSFDPITGTIIYKLINDGNVIAIATGIFGCDIALSQVSISNVGHFTGSWFEAVSKAGHAAADTLTQAGQSAGGALGDFFGNLGFSTNQAVSGVADSLRNSQIQPSISGQDGNRAMYWTSGDYILFSQFVQMAADDPARNGRPLMAPRTISALSGYIKTQNAHIEGNGSFTLPECQRCEMIMNGGFYYE